MRRLTGLRWRQEKRWQSRGGVGVAGARRRGVWSKWVRARRRSGRQRMWLIKMLETSDEAAAAGASQSRIALRRSRREEPRKKRTDEEEKKGEIKEAFFIKKT